MAASRVHELAKEFGVPSQMILAWFKELGFFVESASSSVAPHAEKALRDAYGQGNLRIQRAQSMLPPRSPRPVMGPLRPSSLGHRRPGDKPFAPPRSVDKNLADAATMFGVPVEELKPAQDARPRGRGRYDSSQSRRPLDEWTERLFSVDEKRAWIAAGLGEHDARLADQCISAGIPPDDLQMHVDGVRAVARLRGGESFASVRVRIEEAKRRRQSDAG